MADLYAITCLSQRTFCLTASGAAAPGDNVILSTFTSSPNQQWHYDPSRAMFFSVASGNALDVDQQSRVVLWSPTGAPSQQWHHSLDSLRLQSALSGYCLDMTAGRLVLRPPSDSETQCWRLLPIAGLRQVSERCTCYNITIDGHPEFALHVRNARIGEQVAISRPEVERTQVWMRESRGVGFVLRSAVNGLALVLRDQRVVLGKNEEGEVWQMSRDRFVWSAEARLFIDTEQHRMNQDVRVVVAPRSVSVTQKWAFWSADE
jgi:hypothetical protein